MSLAAEPYDVTWPLGGDAKRMSQPVVPLEGAEVRSLASLYDAATPDLVSELGMVVEDRGGGLLVASTQWDVLALNRVVGIGLERRPTKEDVDAVVSAFHHIGSPRAVAGSSNTGT